MMGLFRLGTLETRLSGSLADHVRRCTGGVSLDFCFSSL